MPPNDCPQIWGSPFVIAKRRPQSGGAFLLPQNAAKKFWEPFCCLKTPPRNSGSTFVASKCRQEILGALLLPQNAAKKFWEHFCCLKTPPGISGDDFTARPNPPEFWLAGFAWVGDTLFHGCSFPRRFHREEPKSAKHFPPHPI
jgi:hypothetical protein